MDYINKYCHHQKYSNAPGNLKTKDSKLPKIIINLLLEGVG
jgi:hypothetical protein